MKEPGLGLTSDSKSNTIDPGLYQHLLLHLRILYNDVILIMLKNQVMHEQKFNDFPK